MAISGDNIHRFEIIDWSKNDDASISSVFATSIGETQSKHIANISAHTRILFELSQKVSYDYAVVGSHRKNTTVLDEYNRILNMRSSDCMRAARFVICKDGRVWSDNTHWTISYILRFGSVVTMEEIPSYIIDFRYDTPHIVNKGNVVFDSVTSIKSAVACAKRIQERVDADWRPLDISYTIYDLMNDMGLG